MKDEEHFQWMVRDTPGGKLYRTRYTCSEDDIRRRHLYAEKVPGSRVVRQIAETEDDLATRLNHGKFQKGWNEK